MGDSHVRFTDLYRTGLRLVNKNCPNQDGGKLGPCSHGSNHWPLPFLTICGFCVAKLKYEQNKYEISVDEHASFDVYNLSIIQ